MTTSDAVGDGTISVTQYLGVVRRRWLLILACLLLGGLAGGGARSVLPVRYTASALVGINAITVDPFGSATRADQLINTANETNVASSRAVASLAAKALEDRVDASTLQAGVSVNVPASAQQLSLSYTSISAQLSADAANAMATAYLRYRSALAVAEARTLLRSVDAQIVTLDKAVATANGTIAVAAPTTAGYQNALVSRGVYSAQLTALRSKDSDLRTLNPNPGEVIDSAVPPTAPNGPAAWLYLFAGLVIGLVLGILLALLRDRSDSTVRRVSDMPSWLPVLAQLPRMRPFRRHLRSLPGLRGHGDAETAAYRHMRNTLLRDTAQSERALRTVLITPVSGSRRRPEVAAALAVSLARSGHRVVLWSLVPLASDLSRLLGLATAPDLPVDATPLDLTAGLPPAALLQGCAGLPELHVLQSGADSEDLRDWLTPARVKGVLTELTTGSTIVVVDGPDSSEAGEFVAVAAAVDGVVLAVEKQHSTGADIAGTLARLSTASATVLGSVLLTRGSIREMARVRTGERRAPAAVTAAQSLAQPRTSEDVGAAPQVTVHR